MLIAAAGIFGLAYSGLTAHNTDDLVAHIVFAIIGIGIVGFGLRQGILKDSLDYDNGERPGRFWLCFLAGLCISFVCIFLPAAAWPFLPVYIMLCLFGSMQLGILGGTLLLVIPVVMTGAGTEVFVMYLVSGLFAAMFFDDLKGGFKTGLAVSLSLACLLVCVTAGTVLVMNERPEAESFVIPAINLLVSGIMLLGILKIFFDKVLYKYRLNYLELNNPENDYLGTLKQIDKKSFRKSIHTAYFCEQIALKLKLDADALRCAGYYHCLLESLEEIDGTYHFPPQVLAILEEYQRKGKHISQKETAVLMVSENVVNAILILLEKAEGNRVDYDKVIDAIFKRFQDAGTFKKCEISMSEFSAMQKLFKEEKLYYDFLR